MNRDQSVMSTVQSLRITMTTVVRAFAVAFMAWGLRTGVPIAVEYSRAVKLAAAGFTQRPSIFESFFFPVSLLAAAAALLVFQRPLIAWLVPVPRRQCLGCGYPTDGVAAGVCPECGTPLPPDSLARPAKPGPPISQESSREA